MTFIRRISSALIGTAFFFMVEGCSHISATSIANGETNTFTATFFLTVNKAEKLDVAAKTKTTSKLIGAKNTETSSDAQTIEALSTFMGQAAAIGAKGALKP